MKLPEGIAPYLGIIAPIVAFSVIGTAILTHPWFSFRQNALSDLGNPDVEMNWIFNSGLILGGLLGLLFAMDLIGRVSGAERFGAVILALAMISLVMIGVFPEGTSLHFPSAISFYLLSAAAMTVFGAIWTLSSAERWLGVLSLILVIAGITIATIPDWDGIAIPETAGAVIIFIWVYMLIWQTYPSLSG